MTKKEAYDILNHNTDYVWLQDNNITQGMIADAMNLAMDNLYKGETIITKDNLRENGWVFNSFMAEKIAGCQEWDKVFTSNNKSFHCILRPYSNTQGRGWNVFADNDEFESVGSVDVNTYEQIDKFIELLSE